MSNKLEKVGVTFESDRNTFYVDVHNVEGMKWGIYKTMDKRKAIRIAERFARFAGIELEVLGEKWLT